MIKNKDLVVNRLNERFVVVQAGSVVSAVRPLGSPGPFIWYPTASLLLVLSR